LAVSQFPLGSTSPWNSPFFSRSFSGCVGLVYAGYGFALAESFECSSCQRVSPSFYSLMASHILTLKPPSSSDVESSRILPLALWGGPIVSLGALVPQFPSTRRLAGFGINFLGTNVCGLVV
jgi:hypothetical protein